MNLIGLVRVASHEGLPIHAPMFLTNKSDVGVVTGTSSGLMALPELTLLNDDCSEPSQALLPLTDEHRKSIASHFGRCQFFDNNPVLQHEIELHFESMMCIQNGDLPGGLRSIGNVVSAISKHLEIDQHRSATTAVANLHRSAESQAEFIREGDRLLAKALLKALQ